MKELTVKNGLKAAAVAGGLIVAIPTVYAQGIGLETLEEMTAGTPQQIERGEAVYEVQCAECHGEQGAGGAPIGEELGADGFVDTEVERSSAMSVYSTVTHGYDYDDRTHPVFENLRYQDRWAVAHYVNSLVDDPNPAPEQLVARIRREAEQGICDPSVRQTVAQFAEPQGEEQLQRGEAEFQQRCASCHGDDGLAEVPAAQTDPPARDYTDPPEEWTNGTSPFAMFNTISQGIDGTAMASFGHLPDEDIWAMVHYIRQEFVPEENLEEVTEEEIDGVCRSLSAPEPPQPIAVEEAVEFLIDDADDERYRQLHSYGDPVVVTDVGDGIARGPNFRRGEELYTSNCVSCHGEQGQPQNAIGPYGKFPPYLTITPDPLVPASAGGTYEDFAQRVVEDVHFSLPDQPTVAMFTDRDWRDLQAWVLQFEGTGRDRIRTVPSLEAARQFLEQQDEPVEDTEGDGDETEDEETEDEETEDGDQQPDAEDGEPSDGQDAAPSEEDGGDAEPDQTEESEQQIPEESETEQSDDE